MCCSRVNSGALAFALLVLAAGCVPQRQAVPSWAIHGPRWTLIQQPRIVDFEARLLNELAGEVSARDLMPPEQIASLAVVELQAGNPWDAAVLLALASHRRHEEAMRIESYAQDEGRSVAITMTANWFDHVAWDEYVRTEVGAYREASFDEELRRVTTHLGGAVEDEDYRNDWMRVAMGNLHDRHATEQIIAERMKRLTDPQPERLAHPELAEAVRMRLSADSNLDALQLQAVRYLAWVPVYSFRASALDNVRTPFDGAVVRAGIALHREDRKLILDSLRHSHPSVRGHAAIILGMVDDLPALTDIERALEEEDDPAARRMFRFALVRLGEHQHLGDLIDSAGRRDASSATQSVILLQWLQPGVKAGIPQNRIVEVVHALEEYPLGHTMAAHLLCDVATLGKLEEASETALLGAFARAKQRPYGERWAARLASAFGGIDSIDRRRVLRALALKPSAPEPWLARLPAIATQSDLELLDKLMERYQAAEQRAWLVHAAASIPGPQAQALLERWFDDHEELRTGIAIQLVLKPDIDKQKLGELSDRFDHDPSTALLDVVLARSSASARLAKHLQSKKPEVRFVAMLIAKLVGGPEHRAPLWQSVDFQDDRYYPQDVLLRHLALSALVDIDLNRHRTRIATVATAATTEAPR